MAATTTTAPMTRCGTILPMPLFLDTSPLSFNYSSCFSQVVYVFETAVSLCPAFHPCLDNLILLKDNQIILCVFPRPTFPSSNLDPPHLEAKPEQALRSSAINNRIRILSHTRSFVGTPRCEPQILYPSSSRCQAFGFVLCPQEPPSAQNSTWIPLLAFASQSHPTKHPSASSPLKLRAANHVTP